MIQPIRILAILVLFASTQSCQKGEDAFDATGTFEASEIIVSAESNGKIVSFSADEGSEVKQGEAVLQIDTTDMRLQIDQVKASMEAIGQKQGDARPQIRILNEQKKAIEANINTLKTQISVAKKEGQRIKKLVEAEAATQKQLDDVDGQLEILKSKLAAAVTGNDVIEAQINASRDNVNIQNRAITSERKPLVKKVDLMESQLKRATIMSPFNGTILSKYAKEGEFISMGRPVFKLADLSEMILRAYISGPQLSEIKIGQSVDVFVDDSDDYKKYSGIITWISDKAEFTPKTIQTKDERANLVYAIKIKVPNDGLLKIGMYGEVDFNLKSETDE